MWSLGDKIFFGALVALFLLLCAANDLHRQRHHVVYDDE